MIVVSDTTPVNYLILIDEIAILPTLFTEIIIPDEVLAEMSHPNAPEKVRDWIQDRPEWAKRKSASGTFRPSLSRLGVGEVSAIEIAIEMSADAVLMDDKRAIREAALHGLDVITTLGLLEIASAESLLDLDMAIDALSKTNFHFPPPKVLAEFRRRNQ